MLKVYVAGAYSADNVIDVLKNIGRGQQAAVELFQRGYAPFCPWHDKEFVINGWRNNFTVQQFLDYSMEWLKVSDALIVVPNIHGMKNWQDSTGTLAEIEMAKKLKIPVCFNYDDLYYAEMKIENKQKNKV